ncbi:MAG: hypothetical protein IJ866_02135 [Alphaproteobacteria bacterium]|nr:hypothetical protein [Alphaproteobacteria bacterium]
MINNSLSEFKTDGQKIAAYNRDKSNKRNPVVAYKADGTTVPLKELRIDNVEFVGGLWRVQNEFPHKIENVRKKDFVIGKKLPHVERTLFDFYLAYLVCENCYGKYIGKNADYIVAKYPTVRGVYSAYGKTIEDARAYLGIKLYDEFQDVIHQSINTQKQNTK